MPQDVSHRPVVPQCPPSRRKHQSLAPQRTQPADGHPKFRTFHSRSKQISQPEPPPRTPTISHHTTLDSPLSQIHNTNLLPHPIFRLNHFSPTTPFPQPPSRALDLDLDPRCPHFLSSSRVLRKHHHHSPFISPRSHRENHNRSASPDQSKQAIPSPLPSPSSQS